MFLRITQLWDFHDIILVMPKSKKKIKVAVIIYAKTLS